MNILEKRIACDGKVYWLNPESKREYGRAAAGLVWPGKNPGYAVIVGEDEMKDTASQVRHYHILAEIEDAGLEAFIVRCHEQAGLFSVTDWYGDSSDRVAGEFLSTYNADLYKRRQQGFYISRAPLLNEPSCFEYGVQTIYKHTKAGKKTLHIGDKSKLPGYLLELRPEEIKTARAGDYPAIAALGYALAALDTWPATNLTRNKQQVENDWDPFDLDRRGESDFIKNNPFLW
jgi:hypothetical protein